jgi:predicted Fe-Mo cluster-binding NifX family protein
MISASMGQGMVRRLAAKGIVAIVTSERDPDAAVTAYLKGHFKALTVEQGCHHGHGHNHHL